MAVAEVSAEAAAAAAAEVAEAVPGEISEVLDLAVVATGVAAAGSAAAGVAAWGAADSERAVVAVAGEVGATRMVRVRAQWWAPMREQ